MPEMSLRKMPSCRNGSKRITRQRTTTHAYRQPIEICREGKQYHANFKNDRRQETFPPTGDPAQSRERATWSNRSCLSGDFH